MNKVLILTDGKAGHENQSKALAIALGCDYELVGVKFKSKFHKALSYFFDRLKINSRALFTIEKSFEKPVAIIGTGSGTFYAVKTVARELGVKCGVILYPRGYDVAGFDCVLAPAFDRPKKAANVVELPVNLVANNEEFYACGVENFKLHYESTNGKQLNAAAKAVAVIIGGPNKCSTMSVEWVKSKLDVIFSTNRSKFGDQCEFWVTTSRRTPSAVEAVVDSYPWNYRLIYSRDHFNPIPAFVKLAQCLYVSSESTGMLSEACMFGEAEVIALDNLNPGKHKFRRFVDDLVSAGYLNGKRKADLSGQFLAARKLMGL